MPPTISGLKKVISLAHSGTKFPAMKLVREDPELAATISKMVADRSAVGYDQKGNRQLANPNIHSLRETAMNTAQNASDAETVMQILPEMELAAQILISSIISPKDMTSVELTYSVTEGLMAADVSAAMIARTRLYFEQVYKIKPLLTPILRDVLFQTGSYAAAVIPENSIDEAINSGANITMESLRDSISSNGVIRSIGLLGPAVASAPTEQQGMPCLAQESLSMSRAVRDVPGLVTFEGILKSPVADSFLSVTDNQDVLKIPRIREKIREQSIMRAVGSRAMEHMQFAMEAGKPTAGDKLNDRELGALLYRERQFAYKPIATLKTQEQLARRTVGNPLIMHLPSESVIPCFVPGSPDKQVGFFVLLDGEGNPVSRNSGANYYQELQSRLNGTQGSFPSAMLSKVSNSMQGFDLTSRGNQDFVAQSYGQMVEADLLARLRNGVYGNGVALAKKEEVWRIMLSRALAKQHTQLLFIPVELMTYFAFRYNDQGIGESLLDKMKIMNSLRSMLLFANVMASVKNSIGRTEVKIKFDEHDPNPQKTVEIAIHEILKSRQQYFPLGAGSPTDIVDWLQRAGMEFTYEGHPGMPDVGVDFGQKSDTFAKPDTELEDTLRKRSIQALGLPPEIVDSGFNAEFATTVVANNVLLAKRVQQLQDQLTPQLGDHIRKVIMNSEELMHDLHEILTGSIEKLKRQGKPRQAPNATAAGTLPEGADVTELEDPTATAPTAEVPAPAAPGAGNDAAIAGIDAKRQDQALVKRFLREFIMNLEVALPQPNSVTLENQMKAMDIYIAALDKALDAWINESFFTDAMVGNIANEVSAIKSVLKAYFLRQWMAENGVLSELSALTMQDEDGRPSVDVYGAQADHMASLTKSLTTFMKNLQPAKANSEAVLTANNIDTGDSASAGGDTGTSDDSGGSDDLGGGDDFSLDDDTTTGDTGGGDAPTGDDTSTPEDAPETPAADAPAPAPEAPKEDEEPQ